MALVALTLLVVITAGVTIFVHLIVQSQEKRRLNERAREVNLVLSTSINTISTNLSVLGRDADDGGIASFEAEARAQLAAGPATSGLALLRPSVSGDRVIAASGPGLTVGQVLTGVAAAGVAAVKPGAAMVATPIYGSGASRSLGFVLASPGGFVVYRQSILGPVRPPSQAGTAPFSELYVALYDSARPDLSQVLVSTTTALPLRGTVVHVPLMAGSTQWLTAVSAVHPLVGSVAANAQWVAMGVGLVSALLVFLLVQGLARRRNLAVIALNAEQRFAETLQRRLLPTVPVLPGLDTASSYVPGADRQQVGGDWFDVFELPSGRVAVVIGDVMGHDIEAAATMAQVRASLRSYAAEGGDPAWTVERLATFIDLFSIPGIVTAVYGVLDPPAPDGSRRFSWTNAGHLPPLLRQPDGSVEELTDASSPLLGAPATLPREVGERVVAPGSTILLYTDGLVEVQGENLAVTVAQLERVLGGAAHDSADAVCRAILDAQLPSSRRRDDVAMLVVRIGGGPADQGGAPASTPRVPSSVMPPGPDRG